MEMAAYLRELLMLIHKDEEQAFEYFSCFYLLNLFSVLQSLCLQNSEG